MDLRSVYIANGVGVFILLMLMYVSRTKVLKQDFEDRIFKMLIVGVMLGCCMEAASYALDGNVFPGSRILNYIANTYLYTVNLLMPFCLLVYVDQGLYNDPRRITQKYKPQIIIGIVMFILTIMNFFEPVCYYITEQNVYERRGGSYIYYLVILYYCITAMVVTKRYEKDNGGNAFFRVSMFLLPILVGAGLQFLFYGLSLAWLSAAIGLTGLYMMQQNEVAYIDSLVNTYNRQYMNQIVTSWINKGIPFSGVMVDIDHFKAINDNYGHSEGDKALKTVTDILKQARSDNEWVFRFAGDEFIVMKMTVSGPHGLHEYMAEVERLLKEYNRSGPAYPLAVSYGFNDYEGGDIDLFLKQMDMQMYAMKAEHHRSDVSF